MYLYYIHIFIYLVYNNIISIGSHHQIVDIGSELRCAVYPSIYATQTTTRDIIKLIICNLIEYSIRADHVNISLADNLLSGLGLPFF